jgi:hypothetical protein
VESHIPRWRAIYQGGEHIMEKHVVEGNVVRGNIETG